MWVRVEGKVGVMKAKRHWPRKAEWPYSDEEGGAFRLSIREKKKASTQGSGDDPRLRRLAQTRMDADDIWGEEILESRRVERMAADEDDDDDDEALAERRRKIREKVLLQQEAEAALLPEESESELESEYESDPVEETAMAKPVFVPKSDRDTITERDKVKAEEQAREVEAMLKILKRKRETREIVFQKIKDDFEIQKSMDDIIGGEVDDDDDVNEEESYEAWKAREIARVKRDRRNMRDEEEEEEEETRDSSSITQSRKRRRRFMQRHYHKGCFFQSDADDHAGTAGSHPIYARDFSDPTGEDKMDKSILPKVMQVKNFGRRGRTKWTHLLNEDTTTHCHWNNISGPVSC